MTDPAATTASSADPYAPAREAGIHRIAIPTPFAVGRVNVYLIEDEPLTLVDAGPNSGISLDELQAGLAALGHAIEDIELVILTHEHMDHLGLVDIVASHSGADVAAIEAAVPVVENYSAEHEAADEFAHETMLRHGIPQDVADALQSVSRAFRAWGASASVSRVLTEGDRVELGDRAFEVSFRPGHSPSDAVFLDRERRILVGGDHLLGHISSNALITRPRTLAGTGETGSGTGGTERPQALVTYLESLARTRAMELDLVLPGHGDPITNHRSLIDERFRLHERRAEKLRGLVAERPRTAYDLAQVLWGNIAVTQAFLTLSEVLGHLDILLNRGAVAEVETDGVVSFEAR